MKTKSETLFESFLAANGLPFEKIKETTTPRPDYLVSIGSGQIIFELKELAEDENFGVADPENSDLKSHSCTPGDHVRRRIEASKKQIQYGAKQGIPSVLLIYNNLDPVLQMFGTERCNFIDAMYGTRTVLIDRQTGAATDWFNGKDQMLQERKNTSFSAIGHLCDRGGTTTVTPYENIFAKVQLSCTQIPPCFNVPTIEVSTEPLTFSIARSKGLAQG